MNIVSTYNNRCSNTYSPESLNQMFMDGLKIDIEQFYQINNRSAHVDIEPQFIPRIEWVND